MATHANRKNQITQLFLENGDYLTQHNEKAKALWNSFKGRLSIGDYVTMLYDLDDLIPRVQLPILDSPFSVEEIKEALTDMIFDHAPRPDDFNGLFMEKCWSTIEHDFSQLFSQFCRRDLNLEHINGSFITLVSKK
jgi:hypothetical protein